MPTPIKTIEEFVAAFITAWPERDATKLAAFFSEDAVYHNGPMEPVEGREAIQATLAAFMGMGAGWASTSSTSWQRARS
jgi:limonene-1,2-epoxide hydrolase